MVKKYASGPTQTRGAGLGEIDFSENSWSLSETEDKARDEKKFKLQAPTLINGAQYPQGYIMLGKHWKEAMSFRAAPAVWDRLLETSEDVTVNN